MEMTYFPYRKVVLAREFNLHFLTPCLQELYDSKKQCFVFSEELRQGLAQEGRTADSESTTGIHRAFTEGLLEVANTQAPAERNRLIYWDHTDSLIKVTPPKHGEYTRVNLNILDVLDRGDFPLMEIHTHPDNSLPSPVDYERMLARLYPGYPDIRLLRGLIVLCPDIQILGLSVPQTAILDLAILHEKENQAMEFTKRENKKLMALKERQHLMIKTPMEFTGKRAFESFAKLMELEKFYLEGRLTKEQLKESIDKEREQAVADVKRNNIIFKSRLNRASKTLNRHLNLLCNSYLLKFPRDMNIALYASTNMTDFEAFSA